MQGYIIAGLCAALLSVGALQRCTSTELAETRADLAVAVEVNEANRQAVERLERGMENTDRVLAGWNEDRTTLAGVRNAARAAVREAMRDETFRAWYLAPAHNDAWRLLNEAVDAGGNGVSGPSGGPAGGLSGNAGSGKRQ
ncbi:MAG: hypothetical protein LBQ10_09825 [Desulfovibrio sp.]|jgi:hypothetical protein|nr:hypothetical protein [Desulfovibrio sp.]